MKRLQPAQRTKQPQTQDEADIHQAIVRGLEDVKAGRSKSAKQFFEEMRRKFNIPRQPA